jgi:hypothetical protein
VLQFDTAIALLLSIPKINGIVNTMISDQIGGWYIGGQFSQVEQNIATSLIHINSSGDLYTNFLPYIGSPGTLPVINALHLEGGVLYIGGYFPSVNGYPRNNLAAFDVLTGSLLPWNPGCNNNVYDIKGNNLRLYVAGNFTQIGGLSRTGLVAFDLNTGLIDTTWNPPSLTGSNIRLELWANDLIAVGTISLNGVNVSSGVVKFQGSNGGAIWSPNVSGGLSKIYDVAVSGDLLFVTGSFSTINSQSRNNIAVFSLPTLTLRQFNPSLPYIGQSICAVNDKIYLAAYQNKKGSFFKVDTIGFGNVTMMTNYTWYHNNGVQTKISFNGDKIIINQKAVSDFHTGPIGAISLTGVPTPLAVLPISYMDLQHVRSIFLTDSMVYYVGVNNGGSGGIGGGIKAFRYRSRTLHTWNPALSTWSGDIKKIIVYGNTVYVSGQFSNSSLARVGLASLNATTGALNSWNPNPYNSSANGQITDMHLINEKLFVAGYFNQISGISRSNLICYNAINGNFYPWAPSSPAGLNGLFVSGNYLYAKANNYLCRIDTSNGIIDSWRINIGFDLPISDVNSASIAGTSQGIYFGSNYRMIGANSRNGLAAFRISTGEILPFNPLSNGNGIANMILRDSTLFISASNGSNNFIMSIRTLSSTTTTIYSYPASYLPAKALALQGNNLYVGGNFSTSFPTINNIVVFNINTNNIISTLSGGTNGKVNTIFPYGKKVFIGGDFTTINSVSRSRIAAIDSGTFNLLTWAPTCNSSVNTLKAQGNTLYGCGTFNIANSQVRNGLAAFDTATGNLRNWAPITLGTVNRLYPMGKLVYVCGDFRTLNSQPRIAVSAIDTANTFVSPFSVSINHNIYTPTINDLGFTSNSIILGGSFTSLSGTDCQYLAVMNYNPATLPVSWIKLSASFSGGEIVRVSWTTQNEINNNRFEVERSINNKDWEIIGIVKGNGNKITQSSYTFDDINASSKLPIGKGILYYRLRQFDYDEKFSISKVVNVTLQNDEFEATQLFPNPSDDHFIIRCKIPSVIRIYDMNGLLLIKSKNDSGEFRVNTELLSTGLYFVEVITEKSIEHLRFLKK